MDVDAWLRIDGETPAARIKNGFPQLIVVGVLVWVGAFVTWRFLGVYLGGPAATLIVLLAGLYVGFDLRDRMIGPPEDSDDDPQKRESDAVESKLDAQERESEPDAEERESEPGEPDDR